MKALSIVQPWASLILHGLKEYETRGWCPNYRGRLAIHVSKKHNYDIACICRQEPFVEAINIMGYNPDDVRNMPKGVILGTVDLVDVIPTNTLHPISERERAFGCFNPGRYAFKLANPKFLKTPIIAPGHLMIYDGGEVPEE